MNIPLPKVVGDVGPGGPFITQQNALNDMRIKQSQAQYAPYTNYADAASKLAYSNMLPYQIQAQVMSNPMVWMALKDNPEAIKAMMGNFQSSIPSGKNIFGNVNMPQPGSSGNVLGNGLVGMLANKLGGFFGSGQGQNAVSGQNLSSAAQTGTGNASTLNTQTPVTNMPTTTAPGSRIAAGGMTGVVNKNTAPYQKNPYGKSEIVTTDQGTFTTPSEKTIDATQQAILGVENIKPLLKDISAGAERFLKSGAKGKLALGSAANLVQQYGGNLAGIPDAIMKKVGVTKEDLSDYAEWQGKIKSSAETISKIRNWPQDELALKIVTDIMEPHSGEGEDYGNRVARQLAEYENVIVPNYKKTAAQGQTLIEPAKNSVTPETTSPSNDANGAGVKILEKGLKLPVFNTKEEFQAWYASQPAITQKAIMKHLGKK